MEYKDMSLLNPFEEDTTQQIEISCLKSFPQLEPLELPDLSFDKIEQLGFAFQNRDADAFNLLVSEKMKNGTLGNKSEFINSFISHCDKLEAKYSQISIETFEGKCNRAWCNKGAKGFTVVVSQTKTKATLWSFNVIARNHTDGGVILWQCQQFIRDIKR